ncbi:nitrite reductase small subunit NirD [Aquibacillus kalidii]|uniref:nitrite reductase small subunit NirD n=1 Tax=Aquibacillus kalidii TaxID=2762597 RepID=UPI0016462BBF|nr:nitrite reductase small subunit NirD [Aquibacillus kalidii]
MKTVSKVGVAHYSALPIRSGIAIQIKNDAIALFKVTSGEVFALEDRSPHPKGGVLSEGLVSGKFVYCPVYDWKISLEDGQVQAPDQGQVKTYEVSVENDKVYITI